MPASPTPPPLPTPRHDSRQPYPFLANDIWADYRRRPTRWPWIVIALLLGGLLAAVVTDWSDLSFFHQKTAQREPRVLPSTPMATKPVETNVFKEEQAKKTTEATEPGSILQVDRTGTVPRLPGATPDPTLTFPPLSIDQQQQPQPSAPDLTLQTSMVRLPPLSIVRIYFPKPYSAPPVCKLASDTVMPSEVSIDEATAKFIVIRNAHTTNDCYFRYYAEGKLDIPKQ